ncbi:MAG: NPCBM/NEW2 domain-containing protein [Roseibacillus sp.]
MPILPNPAMRLSCPIAIQFCPLLGFSAHAAPKKFASEVITKETPGHQVEIEINITGAKQLVLEVTDGGDSAYDWADWVEPRFVAADIAERVVSEVSMMPPTLLNTLIEEEILDLLMDLSSGGKVGHTHFRGSAGNEAVVRHRASFPLFPTAPD